MTTRGGGYNDSSHHDHGDRYVDPKTGEITSDDDYDDHDDHDHDGGDDDHDDDHDDGGDDGGDDGD